MYVRERLNLLIEPDDTTSHSVEVVDKRFIYLDRDKVKCPSCAQVYRCDILYDTIVRRAV